MSRGKRYSNEPKLNIKKVIAVVLVIIAVGMFIVAIKKLLSSDNTNDNMISTTYFTLYSNEKWGVIDNKGKIIIDPQYEEMIIIPDNKEDLFICTENVDYTNNKYSTKVINSKNKEILSQYNNILPIENNDEYNNLWYEKNILKYIKDGKWGLINFKGKEILEPVFENIYSLKGIEGSIVTIKDSKLGLVNTEGEEIIPNSYADIKSLGKDTNLYIVKNEEKKYGIYNKLDTKFNDIKSLNNKDIYCVKEEKEYKVINSEKKEVFNLKFDEIKQIENNIIVYSKDNKYGAYDIDNNKKIKCEYQDLIYTCEDKLIAKKNNSYGIIDINGKIVKKLEYASIDYYKDSQIYELTPKNDKEGTNIILNNNMEEIAKGVLNEVNSEKSYIKLWTEEGYKYYNLQGEEKSSKEILIKNDIYLVKESGKYGFVDKEGNKIIECIYDDATEQNDYGFAAVKKDGKWGAINAKGNIVSQLEHNLDENLLIDFVGKYHLGKDINLLYYTD